ncbi:unnamed protein product [Urochloa humidicola]
MADSAAAAFAFRRSPGSILLERTAYIADRPNGTTAVGTTHAGHAIEVSFQLADPPAPSHLCIFFPGAEHTVGPVDPAVVCSEKDMAVVELRYRHQGRREYFVYKADTKHPSLDSLPGMYTYSDPWFEPHELGLLPGADGGGYHIVILRVPPSPSPSSSSWSPESSDYKLYVLSSMTQTWSIRMVRSPWPLRRPSSSYPYHAGGEAEPPRHQTHKVIPLALREIP